MYTGRSAPPGRTAGLAYQPALDGVRALAVLAVLAYHGGVPWLRGGYLGVDAFFVLSGYLITSLLVAEWTRTGTLRLRAFWARRARRLLPALLLVLVFVGCYGTFVVPPGTYPGLRGDALSTLFYVANWHYVVVGASYFGRTALPSPLTPTWSLAIEEQFYVVWPLVVLLVLTRTRRLGALLGVCAAGALGSALEMALLFGSGTGTARLYYGTDTHAQSLLVGATLAVALAMADRRRSVGRGASGAEPPAPEVAQGPGRRPWPGANPDGHRRAPRSALLALGGLVGAATCALLWSRAQGTSAFVYQGGFLLADVAVAGVLLAAVRARRSPLARLLAWGPLRSVGRISYGMYLWHYPLYLWLDGARTGLTGEALLGVRAAATVAVAAASYHLVERPIRQGSLFRHRRAWALTPPAVAAVVVAVVVLTAGTALPAGPTPSSTAAATGGPGPAAATGTLAGHHRPLEALVIGDSTALTLGMALGTDAAHYGVVVHDEAILGCGVVAGREVRATGSVERVPQPCSSAPPPPGTPPVLVTSTPYGPGRSPDAEAWTTWYRHWVRVVDPNVVVLLAGRWEVMTRTYRGHWTNILHPAFAAHVEHQLRATIHLAAAQGARVVVMTAPCYDPGEQPDGRPWPTASAARLDAYNRLVRRAVAAAGPGASVFTLTTLVCPGGTFHRTIGGQDVRWADGVHFTPASPFLGPHIWPAIVADTLRPKAALPVPAGQAVGGAPSGAQR